MGPVFVLRNATQPDGAFLADMLVEAANWRAQGARPKHEILTGSEHRRYVAGWMRPGDTGVIAEVGGEPIGAAWYRLLPRNDPGFGYVDIGVPELIIGVRPIWRAHGVGRGLLTALCARAQEAGYARLSLSVERGNYATTLYRSEGFAVTHRAHGRDTMVKRLR
ncbi:GNAT family N-acetyltransferase [Microbacterium sp. C7(2022)]|uniref:GNAT family N-acetyltransferase n=1 Tax=Microbacterium sp. C7(2022) TaxID=2992759 RepID=UPI00237B1AB7|nr:GNAT family N-acetyltransferase [Microbacterium sp. C7(2022)]MDE0545902.1 GNAT family N-acetyltransferase [Microbacterium sp. C7(2022)]